MKRWTSSVDVNLHINDSLFNIIYFIQYLNYLLQGQFSTSTTSTTIDSHPTNSDANNASILKGLRELL